MNEELKKNREVLKLCCDIIKKTNSEMKSVFAKTDQSVKNLIDTIDEYKLLGNELSKKNNGNENMNKYTKSIDVFTQVSQILDTYVYLKKEVNIIFTGSKLYTYEISLINGYMTIETCYIHKRKKKKKKIIINKESVKDALDGSIIIKKNSNLVSKRGFSCRFFHIANPLLSYTTLIQRIAKILNNL